MKGVCDNTLGNMLFLKNNNEMARRTMIVRYEDVAVEPFTYAAVRVRSRESWVTKGQLNL